MTTSQLADLPPRYPATRLLGEGAHKSVYLATDTLLHRQVAVAVCHASATQRHDLRREARAMARLGDLPHVVPLDDVVEAGETVCLISRYLPGGTLAAAIKSRPQRFAAPAALLRLAVQLARALEGLHGRGVFHGDLKPTNVLLDDHGDAFVSDFGLSAFAAEPRRTARELSGTLHYMAPERLWGAPPSVRADVYALGCLLYEVATGAPPPSERALQEPRRWNANPSAWPLGGTQVDPLPAAFCDLVAAMLHEDPARRPASCADIRVACENLSHATVRTDAGSPRSGATTTDPESEAVASGTRPLLIQRRRALRTLSAAVRASSRGEPRLLLLEADAGLGKSTLLRHLATEIEAAGGVATIGRAREDARLPYQPFLDALLPLAGRLSEMDPEDGRRLRAFLRLESESHDEPARADPPATGADRQVLFLTVLRALEHLASSRPLALLLDDLHWADRASLDLIEFLAVALRRGASDGPFPIVVAAAHRPLEGPNAAEHPLTRLGAEHERIDVPPFTEGGTYDFLESLGVPRPANGLVTAVHRTTGGNPLFLRMVVDLMKQRDDLVERDGVTTTRLGTTVDLPANLREAVLARTKDTSRPCRRLLTIASFLGDRFGLPPLLAVAGASEEALLSLLDEAVALGLVTEQLDGYRFSHPLLRKAFYSKANRARRRLIHVQIAARLEQLHADAPDRGVPEIAHHLVCAGSIADPEQVLRYTTAAAEQASRTFAWNEAADLYRAAIQAARQTERLSPSLLAELHRRAALAHRWASDTGLSLEQFDAAIAAFAEAGDDYGRAEALAGRLATAVSLGGVSYGQMGDVEAVERALSEHASEPELRAHLLNSLAIAYWAAQKPEEAQPRAREALELARAQGNDRLASDISIALALSQLQQLEPREALATWTMGREAARRANDPVREDAPLQRIPMVQLLLGHLDDAKRSVEEADRLSRRVHNPANLSLTLANRATLAAIHAEAEEAQRHASACMEVAHRARYGWGGMIALPALACAHALRGNRQEARDAIGRVLTPGIVFDDPSYFAESMSRYHLLVAAYAGEDISTNVEPDFGLFEPGPNGLDFAFVTPLCVEVEIAWFSGATSISPIADRALALADLRDMVFSIAWPFFLPRLRGLAAAIDERWDDAERAFSRAIEMADEKRVTPEQARSRLDLAAALLTRSPEPELDRAAALLRQSMPWLRQAGMVGFERRARRLAESAGISL